MTDRDVVKAFGVFGDSASDDDVDGACTPISQLPNPLHTRARVTQQHVTVTIKPRERTCHEFTPESVSSAAACLRTHGMVILEGVFDADAIVGLGKAAIADLEWALTAAAERLKLAKDTSTSGKVEKHHEEIVYEELACRQEGRFEVRGGAALASALGARESLEGQRPGKLVLPLQTHPGILSLLQVACGAPGHQLSASEPGDTVIARDVGAFVSLPGAKDQRLHADNDHLFWHTTLPPHVVTMFLPGLTLLGDKTPHPPGAANSASATDDGDDGDEAADSAKVGWTTFIPGTHTVEGAAKVLADPEASIPQRSLSPHLTGEDKSGHRNVPFHFCEFHTPPNIF